MRGMNEMNADDATVADEDGYGYFPPLPKNVPVLIGW
jgi:hypothetical protein